MKPYWIVFLILLVADVSVGWMISESPMPLLLAALGMVVFGIFRIGGRGLANWSVLVIAAMLFFAEWWLFEKRLARVMLSDLPVLFHIGVAIHFWLWGKALVSPTVHRTGLALLAGALVFWTAGTTEIYSHSKLLVRSLAALGLVLPAVWHVAKSGRTMPLGRMGLAVLTGSIFLGALVVPMDAVSGKIYVWANRETDETYLADSDFEGTVVTVGKGAIDESSRELPKRADLELDDEIRAHLVVPDRADFAKLMRQPVYLKTSALSVFETESRLGPDRRANWVYDSSDGAVDGVTFLLPYDEPAQEKPLRYSVLIDRELVTTLPLLSGTDRVAVDSLYEFANGWWQIEPEGEAPKIRFDAAVTGTNAGVKLSPEDGLPSGMQSGNLPAYPFLTVPDAPRYRDLAESIGSRRSPLATRLAAVDDFFEKEVRYSLKYRNELNLEPLENFLFEEKRGHCELFAAATVLLLRHLDVPCRIAYGYLGGEYDLENRLITFRDNDYHSWPEIYVKGEGWRIFDTTPGDSGRVAPPTPTARRAGTEIDLAAFEEVGKAEELVARGRSPFEKALDSILLFLSRNFMLLIGLAAAALWGWSLLSKRKRQTGGRARGRVALPGAGENASELPRFAMELMDAGRERGLPKRASQTWREFIAGLKSAGVVGGEFDEMIDYLYAIRYSAGTRDRALERQFSGLAKDFRKETAS